MKISNFEFRISNCCARKRRVRNFQFAISMSLLAILFAACRVSPPPANGWAIVAANPQTGDVGVAGASCSEYPFDYRAALVPGKGALVQLGVASPLLRDRASAWIEAPMDAKTIVQNITRPVNDLDAAKRQWAVITFRGNQYHEWSFYDDGGGGGSMGHNPIYAANFIGKGMQGTAWNSAIYDALLRGPYYTFPLSDRLLLALEAGSAAGGIALCNRNGVQQTASTAFVMMARGGDSKFQVNTLGNAAAQEPNPPYLALSVTEPIGGKNPLLALREQYNAWRTTHLPECADCLTPRVNVPRGGTSVVPSPFQENALWLVSGFVLAVMLVTILYFVLRPRLGRSVHLASEQ